MARVLKGSQFYLHTSRSSANEINHTCLCFRNRSWYSFTDPGVSFTETESDVRCVGNYRYVLYGRRERVHRVEPLSERRNVRKPLRWILLRVRQRLDGLRL